MKLRTREILDRTFRASAGYELVLYDRLEPELREQLAEVARETGFYGVVRRRGTAGDGIKSVDRETALLLHTLREPGPLPGYVTAGLGEGTARDLAQLVADGVLEIEENGTFLGGPAALDLLGERESGRGGADGRLAGLSRDALRHAQRLAEHGPAEPAHLALRLYGYNRRPLTPAWKRRLPGPVAVEELLGIAPGGTCRALLDRGWIRLPSAERPAHWLSWGARAAERTGAGGLTYKLYVSPAPEELGENFGDVLAAFGEVRAPQFKVGADAGGLLRPDKIVAYFPSFERLAEAADALSARLAGVPAHGVPFTSEIGGAGLLSWGIDPPVAERAPGESWRFWLSRRLARALVAGLAAEHAEPWRFALDRLGLEGIDTDSWTPGALLWRQA